MIIFRILSLLIIAAALMLLGADVISYMESNTVSLRPLMDVIQLAHADTAAGLTEWKDGLPAAAKPVFGAVFDAPSWLPLGVVGVLIAFLFRERG